MKSLLILFTLLLPTLTSAQKQSTISYEAVVDAKGISANDLQKRAKYWFLSTYPESVLHVDTTDRKLIGVGVLIVDQGYLGSSTVRFTAVLDFKDEKYRYRLFDFKYTYNMMNTSSNGTRLTNTISLEDAQKFVIKEVEADVKKKLALLHQELVSAEGEW